jgi:ComF family protein
MYLHKFLRLGMDAVSNTLERLGHTLLPNRCLLCMATVKKHDGAGSVMCEGCIDDLPQAGPACPRCAEPLKSLRPLTTTPDLASAPAGDCSTCRTEAPAFERSVALWRYEFPLDSLISAFKYRHQLALAQFFGEQLAQQVQRQIARGALTRPDVLLAMPLHPRRLAERGFNQSLLVAQIVSRRLQLPLQSHWLQRVRHTPSQTGLPWQQRGANVESAFRCKADVAGQHVAVVDDVMTTGSSLQEVARTLKLAGAIRVDNWVLARTAPAGVLARTAQAGLPAPAWSAPIERD